MQTEQQLRRQAMFETTVTVLGLAAAALVIYGDVIMEAVGPSIRAWTGG